VQEHRHSLPQIAGFLAENNLEFLGFEPDAALRQGYQMKFPDDAAMTDLGSWHVFESENPKCFVRMYQFWVQNRE
jgi:hypothetical protein